MKKNMDLSGSICGTIWKFEIELLNNVGVDFGENCAGNSVLLELWYGNMELFEVFIMWVKLYVK